MDKKYCEIDKTYSCHADKTLNLGNLIRFDLICKLSPLLYQNHLHTPDNAITARPNPSEFIATLVPLKKIIVIK